MHTFSNFFVKNTVKIATPLFILGAVLVLYFVFFNARVTTAQSTGGPTAGQRFTLTNGGGGQTLSRSLGTWAFCMLVENKIEESGGSTNHSCRIDGGLNSAWTLVSYVGSKQNGQCSAFCVKW